MRKLCTILLLAPSLLLGGECCFAGFYADVGIGAAAFTITQDWSQTTFPVHGTSGDTGFAFQGNVGADVSWNCFLFGLNFFGQYNAPHTIFHSYSTVIATNVEIKTKLPGDLGVQGIFSYMVRDFLFYGSIGADWGWVTYREKGDAGSSNSTHVHPGLRVGGGGKQFLTNRLYLREDFAYTWFSTHTFQSARYTVEQTPRLASTIFSLGLDF